MSNDQLEEYWDLARVRAEVSQEKVVVGQLFIMKWTKNVAFVRNPELYPNDIIVYGLNARNHCFHGDLVAVNITTWNDRVLDGDGEDTLEGQAKPSTRPVLSEGRQAYNVLQLQEKRKTIAKPTDKLNEDLGAIPLSSWQAGKQPQGNIVYVYKSEPAKLVCRTLPNRNKSHAYAQMKSYDERYPYFMLPVRSLPDPIQQDLDDCLLYVEVRAGTNWAKKDRYPAGKFIQSLGCGQTVETESKAILLMNKVDDAPFSEEVEECVVRDFKIPPAGAPLDPGRTDLRKTEFICTIDPETARDLDDALSICKIANGNFRVGVHIADVSHFVPVGSALDEEAQKRSTSCYLIERVIPMLPRRLSEDYCSLNAGSDKYAFSVLWEINHKGEVVPGSEWFGQSIIRSRCRLSYGQAQKMLEDDPSVDETMVVEDPAHIPIVKQCVKDLWFLGKKMRDARTDRGALSLGKPKLSFNLEDMNSTLAPKGFYLYELKEANNLVEEFMLLANQRVAEKIYEYLPQTALLRKHDKPLGKKIKLFLKSARDAGYEIDNSSPAAFSESMQHAKVKYADSYAALMALAVRTMQLAKYVAGFTAEEEPVSHYALKMELYTHFTSPIRRYADLIVHRDLLLALEIEKLVKAGNTTVDPARLEYNRYFMEMGDVQYVADHANEKKEAARKASEASGQLFLCLYLKSLMDRSKHDPTIPRYFRTQAVVIKFTEKAMTVHLTEVATEQEIFYNNADGRGLQKWIGDIKFDQGQNKIMIQWDTRIQQVRLLHEFTCTLVVLKQTPMTFAAIIHPPEFEGKDFPEVEKLTPHQLAAQSAPKPSEHESKE
eukprot:PhF_6_TR623/c0_g1_i1/m.822/K18758/DIS3L2; DIS3-like exonuclease 2